jgi:3-carboxy-cis,cis-muconate cycloisomerase
MSTPLDSSIFSPLFTDPEISSILTDESQVRALVKVEIALAMAQARAGVIPVQAAQQIAKLQDNKIDLDALTNGTLRSGFPIIALVKELRKHASADAAPFIHWGATTQDIMDTASVLQIRTAIAIVKSRMAAIAACLSGLAERHRTTVMAGRTHGQQALPITFGLKVAGWLAPLIRHWQRLEELLPRLLVVQFGGASGTLAALGDKGLPVAHELAKELELGVPSMPWHSQRDSLVEFAGWLSLVTGCLAKMAQDIILLAQSEVGEVLESAEEGRGGSSTMPQKSNPITSELIVAAARSNAASLSALHNALIQEHERATHGWQVEWLTLPQMVALTGGALKQALYLVQNLQIDGDAMRRNIARSNDLILAEAAVFALAQAMPRAKAEELVKQACVKAPAENRSLIEVVRQLTAGAFPDSTIDWQALARPEHYLGATEKIIDHVRQQAKKTFSL